MTFVCCHLIWCCDMKLKLACILFLYTIHMYAVCIGIKIHIYIYILCRWMRVSNYLRKYRFSCTNYICLPEFLFVCSTVLFFLSHYAKYKTHSGSGHQNKRSKEIVEPIIHAHMHKRCNTICVSMCIYMYKCMWLYVTCANKRLTTKRKH